MSALDARTVIVSGADTGYFSMLMNLLRSLECARGADGSTGLGDTAIAVFDLGLDPVERQLLESRGVRMLEPRGHFGVSIAGERPVVPGLLVRPFLEDYLAEFDCFIWVDADAWLQQSDTLRRLESGARRTGMAIAHEREQTYDWPLELRGWVAKHSIMGYGIAGGLKMLSRPMLNAGVYAIARGAPHVGLWRKHFARAIERTGRVVPHDQFSLNAAIWLDQPETDILEPRHNWICNRSLPRFDEKLQLFCTPAAPHRPLGIVHLAGHLKTGQVEVRTTVGQRRNMVLCMDPAAASPT
ncbi:MAG: hypothetical protein R3C97_17720 [Geminicoccaceae bacterium]